ncbi:MAG: hypothetical protein ACREX3_07355, partial [Gammaproteobacteria bacterium]
LLGSPPKRSEARAQGAIETGPPAFAERPREDCPSWDRTRTLLIQSRAERVCLEDTMSVSGCPSSIGARRLARQCPDWSGETLAKRL